MNFELRAPTEADAAAVAAMLSNATEALFGVREETKETVLRLWRSPGVDLEADARLAVARDGKPTGSVVVIELPGDEPRAWIEVESADPVVVGVLVDWAEPRAAELARGGRIFTGAWVAADRGRLFESRGFRRVRRSWRMGIDLSGELEQPVWPEGVTVRPATGTDARGVYETQIEAFEDHWESTRWTFEQWSHWHVSDPGEFDPSFWFLAIAGEELAGISLCAPDDAEQGLAWVDVLGVRRPWRRRGLGLALLRHSFLELRDRGFARAVLDVDAKSVTGANRLYERAGMEVERVLDRYEKAAPPQEL